MAATLNSFEKMTSFGKREPESKSCRPFSRLKVGNVSLSRMSKTLGSQDALEL